MMMFITTFSYDINNVENLGLISRKYTVNVLTGDEKYDKFCYAIDRIVGDISINAILLDKFLGVFTTYQYSRFLQEIKEKIIQGEPYRTKYVIAPNIDLTEREDHPVLEKILVSLSLDAKKILKFVDLFYYELKVNGDRDIVYKEVLDDVKIVFVKKKVTVRAWMYIHGYGKLGELIDKTKKLVLQELINVYIGPNFKKEGEIIDYPVNFVYCEEIDKERRR